MTLILKKRNNYDEKECGYRLLLEDDFNGLYISSSTIVKKTIELEKDSFKDFKITASIYQDDRFVCRFTGIARVEDYEGNEVIINE